MGERVSRDAMPRDNDVTCWCCGSAMCDCCGTPCLDCDQCEKHCVCKFACDEDEEEYDDCQFCLALEWKNDDNRS